jgi:alkylation response protein AidB-like acyl-CoA dehydrogenase
MQTDQPLSGEHLRTALNEFLCANPPGRAPRDAAARLEWHRAWRAILADGGFAGPSWPREYGGMNLAFADQVVYANEIARARVPGLLGNGVQIAAPTIIVHGNSEQRRRWLRPLLRADEIWAQAWSEPDAGSDLPSLRTKADLVNDVYVVNGQKIWSTAANIADRLFVLVRTGPPGSRQDGISYLVISTGSPGVTIRPITDIAGQTNFSEIFFDDVEVPVSDRLGEENGGWAIARTSLGHERAAVSLDRAARYRRVLDELVTLTRSRAADEDEDIRRRLVDLECLVQIMYVSGARTIADIVRKGEPGPTSSLSRLLLSIVEQRVHEVAVDMLGAEGLLMRDDEEAVERGRWIWGFLRTRGSTIGGGTAEIQRNTIGERILGLPREPELR